ncbi:MAG: sigma-70 family RNA polymerase sigma factor [Pyrinomonadaceae bacterium]|nr:sigma-70 family RNA polymerase sigma factor [Pyrinomonadaceae bacterium]
MMRLFRTTTPVAKPAERIPPNGNCATLIKLTAAGDRKAFARLYDGTSGLLFGLLLRILVHTETAEQVLEQVYLEVWKRAREFDEEKEKSLSWIINIAHRRGIARLKELRGEQNRAIPDTNLKTVGKNFGDESPKTPDFDPDILERQRLVTSAVNALSPAQRETLELKYFSGMKESEIAEHLGQTPKTVRLSLNLATKKLTTLFSFLDV